MKYLKVLGLALVAALAMSVTASAAQAEPAEFASEVEDTTVKATQTGTHVFEAAGATISCTTATFEGRVVSATKRSEHIDLTPSYGGCTFLGVNVSVEMRGCIYRFHAGEKTRDESGGVTGSIGTVDVIDAPGKNCATEPIRFSAPGCTVTVGPQNSLKSITYKNVPAPPAEPKEVSVVGDVTGITYTSSGILCPKRGTFSDGHYTGNALAKGFDTATGAQVSIGII